MQLYRLKLDVYIFYKILEFFAEFGYHSNRKKVPVYQNRIFPKITPF